MSARTASGCHTLERVVRSTHDADQWTQVVRRMKGYAAVSQPIKPQRINDPGRRRHAGSNTASSPNTLPPSI